MTRCVRRALTVAVMLMLAVQPSMPPGVEAEATPLAALAVICTLDGAQQGEAAGSHDERCHACPVTCKGMSALAPSGRVQPVVAASSGGPVPTTVSVVGFLKTASFEPRGPPAA